MDAQILGVLCLLGAVPAFDLVFYGRNALYLENDNVFLFSRLYLGGATLEVEKIIIIGLTIKNKCLYYV